ncbi:uncharacterized protein LOC117194741 [Drosophila miranda]|uniref:uncharacterized protein LOC117194740 n=1 Tax=Drosophila miranda TaxID=7229 RepID=UPI00143F7330|nr:uncharacterized protein LOC117194740 [Drosophila miranda]XP_033255126.1 uncharacterized protein LOC117194741 [Drosophila miranda]
MRPTNYAHYASREFQERRGSCWRGSSVGLIAGFIGIKLLLFVAISRRRLIRRFRSRHWILHLETYLGPHKALHRSIGCRRPCPYPAHRPIWPLLLLYWRLLEPLLLLLQPIWF